MEKHDDENPTDPRDTFIAGLTGELQQVAGEAVQDFLRAHPRLAVKEAPSVSLIGGERRAIAGIVRSVFLRNATLPEVPELQESPTDGQETFIIRRDGRAANQPNVVFHGSVARVMQDFSKYTNDHILMTAFGIHLGRRVAKKPAQLSVFEVAGTLQLSYGHTRRELHHGREDAVCSYGFGKSGWGIRFEEGGDGLTFQHQLDPECIGRSIFRGFIEAAGCEKAEAAKKICELLIRKYLSGGLDLTVQEIIEETGIPADDAALMMTSLEESLPKERSESNALCLRLGAGLGYRLSLCGDATTGWHIEEPAEKLMLAEGPCHPLRMYDEETQS